MRRVESALPTSDQIVEKLKSRLPEIKQMLQDIFGKYTEVKVKGPKAGRGGSNLAVATGLGGTPEQKAEWRRQQDEAGQYTIWDREWRGGGKPRNQSLKRQCMERVNPNAPQGLLSAMPGGTVGPATGGNNRDWSWMRRSENVEDRRTSAQIAEDNNELIDETRADVDQTAKLNSQLE